MEPRSGFELVFAQQDEIGSETKFERIGKSWLRIEAEAEGGQGVWAGR